VRLKHQLLDALTRQQAKKAAARIEAEPDSSGGLVSRLDKVHTWLIILDLQYTFLLQVRITAEPEDNSTDGNGNPREADESPTGHRLGVQERTIVVQDRVPGTESEEVLQSAIHHANLTGTAARMHPVV
jgi:hypothetical protein